MTTEITRRRNNQIIWIIIIALMILFLFDFD